MDFDHYQTEVVRHADPSETAHELVPLLGLGGHVGALLLAQQRYLCESLVAETSRGILARELGMVVRSAALLAHLNLVTLRTVAYDNLLKVDQRARRLGLPGISQLPSVEAGLDAGQYQAFAAETDQEISAGVDPLSLSVPMLGLAGEAGNLLVQDKKRFSRDSAIEDWRGFVAEELGDLLWYVATLSGHLSIDLGDVLTADLRRLLQSSNNVDAQTPGSSFDLAFPGTERVPRQLHLQFQERTVKNKATVAMTLLDVSPNPFPDGPVPRENGKFQGFEVGQLLGDEVDDNSRRVDAYRFHDAIHLGFLAVLGWSPNLRNLLNLKRKSDEVVDDAEDGARAVFAEEGLAAILAKQAPASRYFETPGLVPEVLLDLINTVVEDLEVADLPYRLWREAISQGFTVMRQLADGGGGYVLADLDTRTLQYSKFPFRLVTPRVADGTPQSARPSEN